FDPWAGCPSNLGWVHRWKGYSPNNFIQPTAIAIDNYGKIWVADTGYNPNYIEEFDSGGTTWITQWPTIPNCVANGMAVTSVVTAGPVTTDYIYISDIANQLVEEYDQNGNLIREWGNPHGPHEFQPFKPSCIALDTTNNQIIVGDQNNDTIEVFGP
ncbi:MAG TPA: hypothetical protein VMV05_11840, partial [bacterium]|nr:hypothetical protein [bacterium]